MQSTFSSVEYSGSGRYGDAMNPWGDRQAVARWCMTKKQGRLTLAVPWRDNIDIIEYNAHGTSSLTVLQTTSTLLSLSGFSPFIVYL